MATSRSFFIIAICMLLAACKTTSRSVSPHAGVAAASFNQQQLENNKSVVLKLYQALNDANFPLAQSLVATDFKHHYVKDTGFAAMSWAGFLKGYSMSQKAFPDWKLQTITMIAEGDFVSVLLSGTGTHLAEFAGIPATNVRASAPIMLLHQLKNGKIVADWEIMNSAAFLEQLRKQ